MKYEVWSEGYVATGEHGDATFQGTFDAPSFREACEMVPWSDRTLFDPETLTFWGCRLFDNEDDARKSFG